MSLGFPTIDAGGEIRHLAALPTKGKSGLRMFSAFNVALPRSAWQTVNAGWLGVPIWDQNGKGACGGFGGTKQFAIAHRLSGHKPRNWSPWFLYAMARGTDADTGVVVSDLMHAIQDVGVLPAEANPSGVWQRSKVTQAMRDEAKKYRVGTVAECRTFDEAATACQLGYTLGFGIDIGQDFNPDAEGFLPPKRGEGGGHYVACEGMVFARGKWWFVVPNSWTERWGKGGRCFIDESYFPGGSWWEGFAIRNITDEAADADDPAPAA